MSERKGPAHLALLPVRFREQRPRLVDIPEEQAEVAERFADIGDGDGSIASLLGERLQGEDTVGTRRRPPYDRRRDPAEIFRQQQLVFRRTETLDRPAPSRRRIVGVAPGPREAADRRPRDRRARDVACLLESRSPDESLLFDLKGE